MSISNARKRFQAYDAVTGEFICSCEMAKAIDFLKGRRPVRVIWADKFLNITAYALSVKGIFKAMEPRRSAAVIGDIKAARNRNRLEPLEA